MYCAGLLCGFVSHAFDCSWKRETARLTGSRRIAMRRARGSSRPTAAAAHGHERYVADHSPVTSLRCAAAFQLGNSRR